MERASHSSDAVGIDPEFEKAIEKEFDHNLKQAPGLAGMPTRHRVIASGGGLRGKGDLNADRTHSIGRDATKTPLQLAHVTMSNARNLCRRLHAFIDAMVGEEGPTPEQDATGVRDTGAMGALQHDAVETSHDISDVLQRLVALENTVLGTAQNTQSH